MLPHTQLLKRLSTHSRHHKKSLFLQVLLYVLALIGRQRMLPSNTSHSR